MYADIKNLQIHIKLSFVQYNSHINVLFTPSSPIACACFLKLHFIHCCILKYSCMTNKNMYTVSLWLLLFLTILLGEKLLSFFYLGHKDPLSK